MTEVSRGVPVPAVPPRPPQLSLIASSIRPPDTSDPSTFPVDVEQYAALPSDLRMELDAQRGEAWTRGITYAPENQYSGVVRDPCDFSTVDLPSLPAPSNLAAAYVAGGGTIAKEALEYVVTAVNSNGETTASTAVKITPAAGSAAVKLTWTGVEENATYWVYGRKEGVKKRLAEVGPFDVDQTVEWLDTGSATPGAKSPPTENTTGGPGSYTNLAIVSFQPYLVVAEDWCSSFGFEERDFKGRALRLLDNATPAAVEHEFWTGALAQARGWENNYLMKSGKVTNLTPGTVPSVERGLAILQDYLANTGLGGQGMIHVQPQTTTSLLKVRRVGSLLFDIFDNIVVPGSGYPMTGPGGEAPKTGNAFIACSDLVMTRTEKDGTIFPETFAQAFDWGQAGSPNTIRFRAERFAAAYFDGFRQACCEVVLPS